MALSQFSPLGRTGHVSVSHKGYVYVWGGYKENEEYVNSYFPPEELAVYCSETEKWEREICCIKDGPSGTSGSTATIIGDYIYVFGGYCHDIDGCSFQLYRLCLKRFVWEKLHPSGPCPFAVDKTVSWHHDNKLYIFGGFGTPTSLSALNSGFEFVFDQQIWKGWTNQLYEYDPEKNSWNIPAFQGELPLPRAAHAAAVLKDKVYIFGGRHNRKRMNDLHCLDMRTLKWSGRINIDGPWPEGRSWHSFTALSRSCILLYGGFNQENKALNDCWLFDTENVLWKRICLPFDKPRLWHSASRTIGDEVMIFGGCSSNILNLELRGQQANETIFICVTPKPLLRLCIEKVSQLTELVSEWSCLPHSLQLVLNLRQFVRGGNSLDGS